MNNILTVKMLENLIHLEKTKIGQPPPKLVLSPSDYDLMEKYGYDMTNYVKAERAEPHA